mmetsp:Transcript_24978/g.31177  ORF Transcript_24978/g.31177 Transcript_24978/m.31177 type:complete len:150 (-) Transcript_24978:870-1319(-)|eukprot:CAMPEP_0170452472 /NCGR_PEP_ID=MMETSP0123-20130129/1359_1 /TAXON_ID=182087 /ORGANISM="Favella ehrenbergii, Strain Fehren 1" /LENGTH=149 /DNA_ID=CAMNT_0010714489 /DNA_START=857 /DNA_END=1306 /DNA_ORIENTATION=+
MDAPILIDVKVVHRRYTDFVILHTELVDQHLHRFVPAIPSKSLQDKIAVDESSFVLERRKQLQCFIDEVLADAELSKSGIIYKFLSFNERQFELLRNQMLASQEKRVQMPRAAQPEQTMTSSFSSMLGKYLYVPLSGTPTNLVPHMLEQ